VLSTFRHYFVYSLLDAASAGILSNAGLMALKGLAAEDWHLGVRLPLSSIGMFGALFLGAWMARQRKMPFVVVPGVSFAAASFLAALFTNPLWFLGAIGVGSAFEMATHPAIFAVLRVAIPATHRATVVGESRKWSSLVFLISILGSAAWLALTGPEAVLTIRIQLCLAGVLSLWSFLTFRRIHVNETELKRGGGGKTGIVRELATLARPLTHNPRFRRYAVSSFLFGFSGLIYVAYVEAVLVHDLKLNYVGAATLLHVIPSLATFVATGYIGRWIDRTNPWRAWGWVRFGWALDPIILSVVPLTALTFSSGAVALATLARMCRGTTMGGSWLLWWRIGVNHFAPPGAETSRYMGVYIFLNGIMRLVAPIVGGWLIYRFSRSGMLAIGGVGVLVASMHAFWEASREKPDPRFATISSFESQFKHTTSSDTGDGCN
jgi:hypothetical protein